jgi:hypothetical protein
MFRPIAVTAAALLLIFPGSAAHAAGTVVVTKPGGKPQSFTGARLVLKSGKLIVSLPDGRGLVFNQSSCSNTVEIMQCQPIDVILRNKSGGHDLDFTDGIGYFNLTKAPQMTDTNPPQKLPRNGLFLYLKAATGASVTIHGTLDVGVLAGN